MLITLKEDARGGKGDLQDHFYLLQFLLCTTLASFLISFHARH